MTKKKPLTVCPSLLDSLQPRTTSYPNLPENLGILGWHFSPLQGLPQSPRDRLAGCRRLKPEPGYVYHEPEALQICQNGFHAHRTLTPALDWLSNPHWDTCYRIRSAPLLCRTLSFGHLLCPSHEDKVCSSHRLILWTFDLSPFGKMYGSYRSFTHLSASDIRGIITKNVEHINYASWYDPYFVPTRV